MANKTIYLDYAAATPLDSNVLAAMQPYLTDIFYNPSAPYQPAREVRNDIESTRASVARTIGARPTEIIFTAGATESVNLAFNIDGHVITTQTEHAAVLRAAKLRKGSTFVGVNEKGRVDPLDIKKFITPQTTLVSVGLVNNETGTAQDIKAIAKVISDERQNRVKNDNPTPIYLHTDASQAVGILDINVARLGVDMMTLNGAKIYGPKQAGVLYLNSSIDLQPIIAGGGQERGLRSGTENVANIIGLGVAIESAERKRKTEVERLQKIRLQMLDILLGNFNDLIVIGDQKHHAPHILTVAWPGLDAERILFSLETQDILVATGSACAANKDTRSHVLMAMALEPDIIDGSLRFSFGRPTTTDDIDRAAKIIVETIKQERDRGKRIRQ